MYLCKPNLKIYINDIFLFTKKILTLKFNEKKNFRLVSLLNFQKNSHKNID